MCDRAVRRGGRVPGRREAHPAALELDRAADVRVGHVLEALLAQLAGQLGVRHHLRARALGDVDDVAVVVGVPVGQEDVRRLELRGLHGGLRIAAEERVDEHARVAVGQLEARMAQEADVHVQSPSVSVGSRSKFAGQLPADGHADQHAHAGLLREQRLDPGGAGGLVRLGDGRAYLRLVRRRRTSRPRRARAPGRAGAEGRRRHQPLRPAKRSGSESARTAASTCSSENIRGFW